MVYLQQVDKNPAGFLTVVDNETGKVIMEAGLRQCIHCQYTWIYQPGSGILRGFCFRCNGHTCGRVACQDCYHYEKQIEDIEAIAWNSKQAIEAAVRRQAQAEILFHHPRRPR